MDALPHRRLRGRRLPHPVCHLAAATEPPTATHASHSAPSSSGASAAGALSPGTQLKGGGDAAYTLQRLVHQGPRSRVWRAADAATGQDVVLKVLDAKTPELRRRALREVETLRCLQLDATRRPVDGGGGGGGDAVGAAPQAQLLQLLDWFPVGTSVVVVLEPLHESASAVLHYLGRRGRRGLPLPAVRTLARQLLQSLDRLHSHHNLCHRDVKPSNILLAAPFTRPAAATPTNAAKGRARCMTLQEIRSAPWRLVDFGNSAPLVRPTPWATPRAAEAAPYDTPAYASPEAVLLLPTGAAADLWAAGCVVYEAACGAPLFQPQDGPGFCSDEHHLWQMRQTLGPLPLQVLDRSSVAGEWVDRRGVMRVEGFLGARPAPLVRRLTEVTEMSQEQAEGLAAFLTPLLVVDPDRRATAGQMLKHPWLAAAEQLSDDPVEAT